MRLFDPELDRQMSPSNPLDAVPQPAQQGDRSGDYSEHPSPSPHSASSQATASGTELLKQESSGAPQVDIAAIEEREQASISDQTGTIGARRSTAKLVSGFLPVLRNRNFLTLWTGQVFSQLADKVYLILMIAIIASRIQTADQPISGWVSAIMIAFTVPAVFLGSIAGVFVDRWPKKGILVATNLLRGLLVLGLPLLLGMVAGWSRLGGVPIEFYVLLCTTFLVSTLTQFFAPAEQATIPLVVKRHNLLPANSLYTTTMMAATIIGFAIGEPLLTLADKLTVSLRNSGMGKELLVGGSYAIAGFLLLLVRVRERQQDPQGKAESSAQVTPASPSASREPKASAEKSSHIWADIRDGLSYLHQHNRVRSALIQLVVLFSVFAALAVLAVRLAELLPQIRSSQFGLLLAAGGVGMGLGAILVGQFGQRFTPGQLSLVGSLGMAASLASLSWLTEHLWPTLLLITFLGCCAACVGVPMQTMIQAETPETMRGKVFGLQNNAINIALSLPLALASVAEAYLGLRLVLMGLAGLAIVGGLFFWRTTQKSP